MRRAEEEGARLVGLPDLREPIEQLAGRLVHTPDDRRTLRLAVRLAGAAVDVARATDGAVFEGAMAALADLTTRLASGAEDDILGIGAPLQHRTSDRWSGTSEEVRLCDKLLALKETTDPDVPVRAAILISRILQLSPRGGWLDPPLARIVRLALEHSVHLLGVTPLSAAQNGFVAATLIDLYGLRLGDVIRETLERRLALGDTDDAVGSEVLTAVDDLPRPIHDDVSNLVARHAPDAALRLPRWRFDAPLSWPDGLQTVLSTSTLTGLWGALCYGVNLKPPTGVLIDAPPIPGAARLLIEARRALVEADSELTVLNPGNLEDRLQAADVPTVWT